MSDETKNDGEKNILIAVTGGSPQVITETLYGIIQEDLPWPDEIDILTTSYGKRAVIETLLTKSESGQCSVLEAFCHEYGKKGKVPNLTEQTIYAIKNNQGEELEDARTVEDQEALADFIVSHVAKRCTHKNKKNETPKYDHVHASIAGGRKTMTFYLGYAMSLFANFGDRLSHVLVDSKYEYNPEFFYPTKNSNEIPVYKAGKPTNEPLDTKDASVNLVEIPFIRQRESLKKNIASFENVPYRDLVYYQNAVNDIDKIKVEFNYLRKSITIEDKEINFEDNMLEFAFYAMIASHVKEHKLSYIQPVKNQYSKALTDLFLLQLEQCGQETKPQPCFMVNNGELVVDEDKFKKSFSDRAEALSQEYFINFNSKERNIANTYQELEFGMSYEFFNDRLNKLKKKLQSSFPSDFVHCLVPNQVYDISKSNEKSKKYEKRAYSTSGKQGTPYGLWLKEENLFFK